ncbi:MAG: hypothetical protein JXR63_12950 [Spirochaetales bacterium]|nr:hypothetical protein [Spirochaetales bacterium]
MEEVKKTLISVVNDKELIEYFYLDCKKAAEVVEKFKAIKLSHICEDRDVPFMAKIRGYCGARDQEGNLWLIKEVESNEEIVAHLIEEFAYCLDFMMATLAAPTILIHQDKKFYRATKQIKNAMQIGSYNYLESPFKRILTNDLINRWLFFDEDRNPNNYLVMHNSKNVPLVVVIDYNKVDLLSKTMKIKGNEDSFGWYRKEKTRFLTLLKPSNFENLFINNFERRLDAMMSLDEKELLDLAKMILGGIAADADNIANLLVANILKRRAYINNYFRKMFKEGSVSYEQEQDERYASMGAAFLKYHKKGM